MIYLSIPYTGCEDSSFRVSCVALEKLIRAGNTAISTVVCGHAMERQNRITKSDHDLWLGYDLKLLHYCDTLAVITLDGWEDSAGVKAEIDEAERLGVPIVYLDPDWFVPRNFIDRRTFKDVKLSDEIDTRGIAEITE